jgi:hypothetical protein
MRSIFGTAADNALALFNNAGTYTKSGTGTSGLDVQVLNSGTVSVDTGTLRLGGGGTHTGSFGTTGTGVMQFGTGVHQLQVASAVTGTVLFTGFTQNGIADVTTVGGSYAATNTTIGLNSDVVFNSTGTTGTLTVTGNGRMRGSGTLTVTGTHTLTAGSMTGNGQTILQGTGTISSLNLDDDRLLQIQGTTTWTGNTSQRIYFNRFIAAGGGGTIETTASGVFDIQADAVMDYWQGTAGQFTNGGTIRKTVGTGTTGLDVQVLNSGTVSVQTGTVRFAGASVFTNAGAIAIKPGALVSVTGGYSQTTSGSLSIDVAGLLTTQFGRLTATGVATLDGTFNVALANGFIPTLGDRVRFMTHASRTGFFATTNGLDLGGGLAFQVEQSDPLDLELVTVAAAPASATVQSSGSNPDSALTSDGSLAYVQRSWVKGFVAENGGAIGAEDEELLIALPTGA